MRDEGEAVPAHPQAWVEQAPANLHVVPGARQQLAALYAAHVDFVVQVVRHSGVGARDVEDVVHDVFLVVHRRLDEYDASRSARAWLFGITRNIVLDYKRRVARTHRREQRGLPTSTPADPESELRRRRAASWVHRFVGGLHEDMSLVFALSEIEGMTAPEIARALGIKLNTVYSRLRRVRHKFAVELARAHKADGGPR